MIYPKYGLTFKKIREQKLLSLSSFNQVGISKPALSKFERGLSMMSFESVVRGLQEMGVSLEEFEHFLNDYCIGEKEELLLEIEKAAWSEDKDKLSQLHDHAINMGHFVLAFAAKASYTSLTEKETEEITDLLYNLDIWGYAELSLFYFTMDQLQTKDILYLLNYFFTKGHILFNSEKHRNHIIKGCCRAITVLTSKAYKEESRNIIKQLDEHNLIQTMEQRNLRNMAEGFWIYSFIDKEKGNQMMLHGLTLFHNISQPHHAHYYQQRYNKLVLEEQKVGSLMLQS